MAKILKDKKIRIENGKKFKLKNFKTDYNAGYVNEKLLKADLEKYKEKISDLQDKLFAQNKFSVLLVLQAIDASGKDSCIKHVLSGINPHGFQIVSFKQPSTEELNHDFLWRTNKNLPEKGKIGVFNRSYYEEVLVTKVHPEFIMKQKIPGIKTVANIDGKFWKNRYRAINEMERHLVKSGTVIIKIFLNMSKEEQRVRLLERTTNPVKQWKFNYGDLAERKLWDKYQQVYEDMIVETSTPYAPWHVIPSDNQWVSRAIVGDIILETMESMRLQYPVLSKEDEKAIAKGKAELEAEKMKPVK